MLTLQKEVTAGANADLEKKTKKDCGSLTPTHCWVSQREDPLYH